MTQISDNSFILSLSNSCLDHKIKIKSDSSSLFVNPKCDLPQNQNFINIGPAVYKQMYKQTLSGLSTLSWFEMVLESEPWED